MTARPSLHATETGAVAHEQLVAIIAGLLLFFACSDFFGIVLAGIVPQGPGKSLVGLLMLGFALYHGPFLLRAAFATPELTLLLGLVLLSVLWSIEPELSFKRSFQLYANTLLAMTLASMLSMRSLTLTLAAILGATMLASLVAVVVLPDARGSEQWPDAWRGIFNHKNGLGATALFALLLLFAAVALTQGRARRIFALMFAVTLLLLAASESRTAQLVTMFALGSLMLAAIFRNHIRVWMVLFLAVFLIGTVIVLGSLFSGLADPLFEAIGRRPTLSNRIPLWGVIWPDVTGAIWTGYGYEAYWDPESPRVLRIARIPLLGFTPHYSHNGLVEVLLNVGIFGVPLVLGALFRAVIGASVAMRVRQMRIAGAAVMVILVAFAMLNLTESFILNTNTFIWTVFVAVATKLSLLLKQRSARWRERPGPALRRRLPGRPARAV